MTDVNVEIDLQTPRVTQDAELGRAIQRRRLLVEQLQVLAAAGTTEHPVHTAAHGFNPAVQAGRATVCIDPAPPVPRMSRASTTKALTNISSESRCAHVVMASVESRIAIDST